MRVSIAIPTYNSERFLQETLPSALAQTFGDLEVVVCDNASQDGTPALCDRLRTPRLRYRRFEEFVGQAANWNRCLQEARGELVLLLHADDLLDPEFVARAVAALDAHPQAGLVHCAVRHIDQDGRPGGEQRAFPSDRVLARDEFFRKLLEDGCYVSPAGVMVRRAVYESTGPFTERIVWCVDWHMWLRVALRTDACYLATPLASYRQHPVSGTAGVFASARNGPDEAWALRDVWREVEATRPELAPLWTLARKRAAHRTWCMAEEASRRGLRRAARLGVWNALKIDPALLAEPRCGALYLATFLGHEWFRRTHERRQASRAPVRSAR